MELFNAGEIEDTLIVPVDQLTLDNGLVKDFGGNFSVYLLRARSMQPRRPIPTF